MAVNLDTISAHVVSGNVYTCVYLSMYNVLYIKLPDSSAVLKVLCDHMGLCTIFT